MEAIVGQVSRSGNLKAETSKSFRLNNQHIKTFKTLVPTILGFFAIVSLLVMTLVFGGDLFLKEILASGLIASCILLLKLTETLKNF